MNVYNNKPLDAITSFVQSKHQIGVFRVLINIFERTFYKNS